MSRPEIVEDVIAAAAAVPQALDRLSEEARAAWAGQLATDVMAERRAAGLSEPQPAPQPSAHPPVWDLVVHDMHERDAFGERKYGMRLRAFDGRSTLADAYQEALDLAVYLRKRLYEEQAPLPADVAEVRRAAGITIAPESALHRALQERTDELERVRAERDSALADLMESATCLEALEAERRTVLAMVEHHAGGSPRLVDEVRASLRSLAQDRDAAVDEVVRLVRERDEAQAALAEARAENASLLAVVPPGTHVARVEWGVHAEVTRQRDEILRLTRERDEARASITRFAEAAAAHDANADVFVDDEYHISTRALVEEFCREHGHPLAHEWATAKINAAPDGGAPTAPDVVLSCAPAAGAADPHQPSARALAWACTVFGDQTT